MPPKHSKEPAEHRAPTRWIGDAIGRIAIPIRGKLLIAFLTVVGLMIALALTGMSELREANRRANELVDDQVRISTLQTLAITIQTTKLIGASLFLERETGGTAEERLKNFGDEVYLLRTAGSGQVNVRKSTHFLTPEFADDFFQGMRDTDRLAREIRGHYAEGDVVAAKTLFDTEFSQELDALSRMVFSMYIDLRQRMRARADQNQAAFERARLLVLSASGLAVFLALALGVALSTSIVWPLDRIRDALSRLSVGDFEERVNVPNRDELGELAEHINQTGAKLGELYGEVDAQKRELERWNSTLEERVQSQVEVIERTNRLRRFLPEQVAQMIMNAPDDQGILRARRADITVLFADLRGFTEFANAATPDQVVDALNTFHAISGPLVVASGGTLERFLGDGLMVLFGAPVAMEGAAQAAVDLAKELRVKVRRAIAPFHAGSDARRLGLGIGIGTGAATMGLIGYEGRRDYSAIGPAPNLAARLCDLAGDGQILISHATAWQVRCETEPVGPFDLKGIGQAVAAFQVMPRTDG